MHAWCLPLGIRKRTGKFYHGVAYAINTDLKRHSACSVQSNLNLGVAKTVVFRNLGSHKEVPMNKKYLVRLTDEEREGN